MVIAVMVAATAFASDDGPVGTLTGSDLPLSEMVAPNRSATVGEPLAGRDTSPAEQRQVGHQAGNASFQSWRSGSGRVNISSPPQISSPQTISPHSAAPRDGDVTIFSLDEQGAAKRYSLPAGEKLDIGTVSGAQPFADESQGSFTTTVEGTVVAENGKPIEGIQVYAFLSPDATGEPLFVSNPSCELGRILLKMNKGGTYYLKAGKASVADSAPAAPVPYSTRKDVPTFVAVNTGGSVKGIMINTHNKYAERSRGK